METLALPELLRYNDLGAHGLTRHRFEHLLESQEYERIAPGVFLRADGLIDDTTAAWMAIALKRPEATLCLGSALVLHDLTDEIPGSSDIAIPRGTNPIAVRYSPITWHRFAPKTFPAGRTEHQLPGDLTIGLYGPERTIIDTFRLRHALGTDVAVTALKRWLRIPGNSPSELLTMARGFPTAWPALQMTLEILL